MGLRFLLIVLVFAVVGAREGLGQVSQPAPLLVLAIGNSYSQNAAAYLPPLADAAGRKIIVAQASNGGWSLQRHADAAIAFDTDPSDPLGSPYTFTDAEGVRKKVSLQVMLKSRPWDVVTVQQASKLSQDYATYMPHARSLAEVIRRDAPQANIYVHEIWPYRADHLSYTAPPPVMYARVHANAVRLAEEISAKGILPVGTAMMNVLADPRWHDEPLDAKELEGLAFPASPPQPYGLYLSFYWDRSKSPPVLTPDGGHLNHPARLLAAAVWYEVLTGDDARQNDFFPTLVKKADTPMLKEIAHQTVLGELVPSAPAEPDR